MLRMQLSVANASLHTLLSKAKCLPALSNSFELNSNSCIGTILMLAKINKPRYEQHHSTKTPGWSPRLLNGPVDSNGLNNTRRTQVGKHILRKIKVHKRIPYLSSSHQVPLHRGSNQQFKFLSCLLLFHALW